MKKLNLIEILKLSETNLIIVPTPKNLNLRDELVGKVLTEFNKKNSNERLSYDIKFVVGEMIDNARDHGNNYDISKKISVYTGWKNNQFYFAIQDEGKGFDMKKSEGMGLGLESGLGIYYSKRRTDLLYNFKDSVSYGCIKVPTKISEKNK